MSNIEEVQEGNHGRVRYDQNIYVHGILKELKNETKQKQGKP